MRLPFFSAKAPSAQVTEPAKASRAVAGVADEGPVQAARTQARRRLIGALVLLAAGVIGFPILFETQPRPLPVNTPILVPEGTPLRPAINAAAAVARPAPALPPDAGNETPAAPQSPAPATTVAVMTPAPGQPDAATPVKVLTPTKPSASGPGAAPPEPARPEAAKPQVSQPARVASSPALVPAPAPAPALAPSPAGRFVVQVGAYNDVERMKAARQKLEKLGFKTFTQDVETATGKRTRVRVGPFGSRQEAEAVAAKVKAAGMQANILSL